MKKFLYLHINALQLATNKIIKNSIESISNILSLSLLVFVILLSITINLNIQNFQKHHISYPQMVVYFDDLATNSDISKFELNIKHYSDGIIASYQFIDKATGLQKLKTALQKTTNTVNKNKIAETDDLDFIDSDTNNPLPDILIINTNTSNLELLKQLYNKINNNSIVTKVDFNDAYANKLNMMLHFITIILNFILIFFLILFFIIVYNIIRLQIFMNKEEIKISHLIGASYAFIIRPLLYYSILQIILATVISYVILQYMIKQLGFMIVDLNNIFQGSFILNALTSYDLIQILLILVLIVIIIVLISLRLLFTINKK